MRTPLKRQTPRPPPVHDLPALQKALEVILGLPRHVRERMVYPESASSGREPSLCATRLRGFDRNDELCLYRHDYKIAGIDFDSEDTPYVRVSLHETITAVRTRDGIWLCRIERCEPEGAPGRTHSDTGFCAAESLELPAELATQLGLDAVISRGFVSEHAQLSLQLMVRRRSRPMT
jgi:hypothetical protein